jgi:predicted DNA-binding transcriptional regulator AlpA
MTKMELLTAIEVGEKLKLSESTIWNWQYGRKPAPEGFPSSVKVLTAVRWRDSDLYEFIADLPFSKFGCIKPSNQQLQAFKLRSEVESIPYLNTPSRGRGRPRKVSVVLKDGAT